MTEGLYFALSTEEVNFTLSEINGSEYDVEHKENLTSNETMEMINAGLQEAWKFVKVNKIVIYHLERSGLLILTYIAKSLDVMVSTFVFR